MRATSLRWKTGFLALICLLWLSTVLPSFALPQRHPPDQDSSIQPEHSSINLNTDESAQQKTTIAVAPTLIPTASGIGSPRVILFSLKQTEPVSVNRAGPWTWFIAGIATAITIGLILFTRRTTSPRARTISGPQLTLLGGNAQPSQLPLDKQQIILGREADCDIVITDKFASRKHARIYRAANAFYLEDLKSLNGTLVNHVDVLVKPLVQGDMITIGGTILHFA